MTLVPRGFIISAPASGSGKTMLAIGLIAALRKRGIRVVVAKTGPDYIDSQFLSAAAGCHCLNLDPWAMSENELKARISAKSRPDVFWPTHCSPSSMSAPRKRGPQCSIGPKLLSLEQVSAKSQPNLRQMIFSRCHCRCL